MDFVCQWCREAVSFPATESVRTGICLHCRTQKATADKIAADPSARDRHGIEPDAANPSADRKACPLFSGCLAYFPDALLLVAKLSKIGNDKHNPGEPLHWSKGKSSDHADCLARHLLERGEIDPETGLSQTVSVAWRALALLQTEIDAARAKGGA